MILLVGVLSVLATASAQQSSDSAPDIQVTVMLRGSTGEEVVQLTNGGREVYFEAVVPAEWIAIEASVPASMDSLFVNFINDGVTASGADRNIRVDYVAWETGEVVQAEDVESLGVWNGTNCDRGFREDTLLACDGWFRFPVPEVGQADDLISVNARGTTGEERLILELDGRRVTEWNLDTSEQTYTYRHFGPAISQARVVFDNDRVTAEGDRNVIVTSFETSNSKFDPADVRSSGVWNGSNCDIGFRQSRTLACDGWFEFLFDPTSPSPGDSVITVRLLGTTGTEMARITVGGEEVESFIASPTFDLRDVTTDLTGPIQVQFLNDGEDTEGRDRNLVVDWIEVDGERRAADTLVAIGVYDGTRCDIRKVHESGFLACNGYIEYTPGQDAPVDEEPPEDEEPLEDETGLRVIDSWIVDAPYQVSPEGSVNPPSLSGDGTHVLYANTPDPNQSGPGDVVLRNVGTGSEQVIATGVELPDPELVGDGGSYAVFRDSNEVSYWNPLDSTATIAANRLRRVSAADAEPASGGNLVVSSRQAGSPSLQWQAGTITEFPADQYDHRVSGDGTFLFYRIADEQFRQDRNTGTIITVDSRVNQVSDDGSRGLAIVPSSSGRQFDEVILIELASGASSDVTNRAVGSEGTLQDGVRIALVEGDDSGVAVFSSNQIRLVSGGNQVTVLEVDGIPEAVDDSGRRFLVVRELSPQQHEITVVEVP